MPIVNYAEKQSSVNGLNIKYKIFGNGNIPIVVLHGWGIDSEKYSETAGQLLLQSTSHDLKTKIIIPDLPGFGKSDEPEKSWNLDDYVGFMDNFTETVARGNGFELVKNILKNFNMSGLNSGILSVNKNKPPKFILIGHSFGGRIAIKYAVKHPEKIEKLILTGAAGIKRPLSMKKKIIFLLAKTGKVLFSLPGINKLDKFAKKLLYGAAREKDYDSASPRMKEVMKKIITEDLTPILDQIKIPTLLLWGRDDHSTPLQDGKIMNAKIEGSKMIVVDHSNHSLPYQKPEEFANAIMEFIKK